MGTNLLTYLEQGHLPPTETGSVAGQIAELTGLTVYERSLTMTGSGLIGLGRQDQTKKLIYTDYV